MALRPPKPLLAPSILSADFTRLAEAALPSLAIVAVALVPLVVVLRRYFQPTRS